MIEGQRIDMPASKKSHLRGKGFMCLTFSTGSVSEAQAWYTLGAGMMGGPAAGERSSLAGAGAVDGASELWLVAGGMDRSSGGMKFTKSVT